MSTGPAKVFIKIESSSEQQENLKNIRKQLKPLQVQATSAGKENLTGRQIIGKNQPKSKLDIEVNTGTIENIKRKKYETKSTQTENQNDSNTQKKITENDLTSDSPSENYWESLAEKRRQALEETLKENKKLHEKIECLEEELETSRKMIEEANCLVEVLTEMLKENEKDNSSEEEEEPNIEENPIKPE